MNRVHIPITMLALSITLFVFSGCTKSVSPKDIYRYTPQYPQKSGAQNITVEQTKEGVKITGNGIRLLFFPSTGQSFHVDIKPEDAEIKMNVNSIPFDNSGAFYMQVVLMLGDDCALPAQIPMRGSTVFSPKLYGPIPDAWGSQNVTVKINEQVGFTWYAGLRFNQEIVCNVWKDGVVEVDKEGVEALDEKGTKWISKEVKIDDKTAVIVVRK